MTEAEVKKQWKENSNQSNEYNSYSQHGKRLNKEKTEENKKYIPGENNRELQR